MALPETETEYLKVAAPSIVVVPDTRTLPKKPAAPLTVAVLNKLTAPPTDNVPPIVAVFVTTKELTEVSPATTTLVRCLPEP